MSGATTTRAGARSATEASPRGIAWVVWRQNRTALLTLLGLAVLAAAALLTLGALHTSAQQDAAHCGPHGNCAGLGSRLHLEHQAIRALLYLLVPVPVAVGALLGAGSVAADIESGRTALLFTQSVRPARWLRHRIAVPLTAVLLLAGVVGAAATWVDSWNAKRDPWDGRPDWFSTVDFWSTLPALLAATAFAFTLGVLCALLVRRVLPAVGLTAAVASLAVATVHALRPHLWPAVVVNRTLDFATARDAWEFESGVLDHGARLPLSACADPAHRAACQAGATWTAYHPVSHHWPIQLVASSLLLVPSVLFLCAVFPALRRLGASGRRGRKAG